MTAENNNHGTKINKQTKQTTKHVTIRFTIIHFVYPTIH